MWELDHKEGWAPKNWCFQNVVLEKTLESPLTRKEIKPVNPEGKKTWIFIRRIDAEAEAPIFWPPDVKSWLTGKDSDAGKSWRQKNGAAESEMTGWHHWLNGQEFQQILGDSEGRGSLECCSPWHCRVSHNLAIEEQQCGYVFMNDVCLNMGYTVAENGQLWHQYVFSFSHSVVYKC